MVTMTLTKEVRGLNKVYQLRDKAGAVTEERVSKNDYVACTEDGQVWYVNLALALKDSKDVRRRKVVFLTSEG